MLDLFSELYPWVKSLHIISVISWMAGIFYLPRLYVYHVEAVGSGNDTDILFQTMERRLLKAIMNPAMISTWFFGIILVLTPGIIDWTMVWPWVKALSVLLMTWFHFWLGQNRKAFETGTNTLSGKKFRVMNEVPTILMIIIIFSVVIKF